MIDNIITALRAGEVEILYTSLVSGVDKKVTGTLKDHNLNQNRNNERVVFWDLNNEKYEDIQIDTIIDWRSL